MVYEIGEDIFHGLLAQEGAGFTAVVGDAVDEIFHAHLALVCIDDLSGVPVPEELGSPGGCFPCGRGVGDDHRFSREEIFLFELFIRKVATTVDGDRFGGC